jgi:type VI secretion system protein VasG
LPDKAVDLLDTASARVRMSLDTVPEPLTRIRAQLTALDGEAGAAGRYRGGQQRHS